jgi:sulfur oxidation c-type cytochrome SoxX
MVMAALCSGPARADEGLRPYIVAGDAIAESLTGAPGDPARGKAIVVSRQTGLCLLCHSAPLPEEKFQGTIGPDLAGAGSRYSEGELRLRIVDSRHFNPDTIMPSYYRLDGLEQVAPAFRGKTVLSAEQIEDVVAGAATAAGALGVPLLTVRPAVATPEKMQAAIKAVVGEAPVTKGRVTLDIPPLVENGNTVAMTVTVESPMTPADHVKVVHVFNEKNPQPNVIDAHFGPRAAKASFSSRIRLADTQTLIAIAEMSDGSFWSDQVDVIVTLAACLEYN